jgi:hypothetical protein
MRSRIGALAVTAGVAIAVACGGTTQVTSDGGAASDTGGPGDAGSSPCPSSAPTDGTACGPQGLTCEWGSSPVPDCDTVALCNGGRWQVTPHGPGGLDCGGGPQGTCPASFSSVPRQQHCSPYGMYCDYPEGRCACAVPAGPGFPADASAVAEWICQDPQSGCPQPRPVLGSACSPSQTNLECDYGACSIPGGTAESCTGGIWVQGGVACPARSGG